MTAVSFPTPLPHNSAIVRPSTNRRVRPHSITAPTDARLGRIIRLLGDHATLVVSGTKLADEIGTSRSEVWRLVQQLRNLGVEIAGHPASGYRLEKIPDLLMPETLAPLLKGTIFSGHIHHYFKIASTNSAAMEASAAGAPEGSTFLAEEQTAGRGRGAHAWHSARSQGIHCSVVLRPLLAPAEMLVLSLAAGLAARSAIEEILTNSSSTQTSPTAPLQLDLRWPNDLLLSGKKIAGILTELTAEATRVRYVVVGIGINVNHARFPRDLAESASSLRLATERSWSRVELTAALLKSLHREYHALRAEAGARESILRRFEQRSSFARDRRVRVEENGGFEGVTAGLDEHGFLQVQTAQGLRTVLSGGVRAMDSET